MLGHQGTVSCLQVLGNLLYSASADGKVMAWDIKNESIFTQFQVMKDRSHFFKSLEIAFLPPRMI